MLGPPLLFSMLCCITASDIVDDGEIRSAWNLLNRAGNADCNAANFDNATAALFDVATRRREIRQLSQSEVTELVRAVSGLVGSELGGEVNETHMNALPKCDLATSLRRLLAPYYWDYRLELELSEPGRSSIFELLALAAGSLEPTQKLFQSSMLNITAISLKAPNNQSQETMGLAAKDPTGVLTLLLLSQAELNDDIPYLNKSDCVASDPHWLYWDHVEAKCRAVAMSLASPVVRNTSVSTPSSTTMATSLFPTHFLPTRKSKKKPKLANEKRKKGPRRGIDGTNTSSSTVAGVTRQVKNKSNWLSTATPPSVENSLDSLLPLLLKHKVPKGTIPWRATTPFPVVYFTITLVESGGRGGATSFFPTSGSTHRRRSIAPRLKYRQDHRRGRVKGARVYLMGLNMPTGYMQITQGQQIRGTNGAVVRVLSPYSAGPFVEFKLRVENRYGTACKQMCLEGGGGSGRRYSRCMRRLVRLSTYKRFSDPIPFYRSAQEALDAQWTGKGYYRQRKLDHLLFKCD